MPDSYESLFHAVGEPRVFLRLTNNQALARAVQGPVLEHAIGVIGLRELGMISH